MADENSFVQEIKLEVDDSELRAAVENMKKEFVGVDASLGKKLPDDFKKAGKEAEKTAKETERIAKASDKATKETDKLSHSFGGLAGAIRGAVAAYAGFQGISKLVGFGKGSLEAFKVQARAERMLEFGMRQNGTQASSQELKDYASALQRRTMYGDEAMLTAAAAWQNKIRSVDNSKRMMELVADFAAKSTGGGSVDAGTMRSMAQQLMQALSGRAITLKAQGFDITAIERLQKIRSKGGTVTEDMEIQALERVLAPIRGMARELADTDEGKIEKLKNDIGDMREEIGRELMPVVADLASNVRENMPAIKEMFEGFKDVLVGWMNALSDNRETIVSFATTVTDLVKFLGNNIGTVANYKVAFMALGPMMKKNAVQITAAELKVETATAQAAAGIQKAAVQMRNAGEIASGAANKLSGVGGALGSLKGFAVSAIAAWSASQIEQAISAAWSYFKQKRNENDLKERIAEKDAATTRMLDAYRAYKNGGLLKDVNERRDLEAAVQTYRAKYGLDAAVPDYILKALGETRAPDITPEKKTTKGSTTINNINYTNNITTDSDLLAKQVKENLRTLLTSNLNIVNRAEGAKVLAL